MRLSRQKYWSGLPYPPSEDLPRDWTRAFYISSLAGKFFTTSAAWEALSNVYTMWNENSAVDILKLSDSLGASLVAQLVKNPPVMQEILVQFLDWDDPLEKG